MSYRLLREIISATERAAQNHLLAEDDLPTSADLARLLNLRVDFVKKRLKPLKEADLIQPVGMSPKRYRFNQYAYSHLEADDPLYQVFCEPDSTYYLGTLCAP